MGLLSPFMPKATVRHCVLGTFTESATDEQKAAMIRAILGMSAQIPQILAIEAGLDAGLASGNAGFAVTVDFLTEADYSIYATHEAQVAVINDYIKTILKPGSRTAVQFRLAA